MDDVLEDFLWLPHSTSPASVIAIKVKRMQRSGTEAIRTQFHPLKPKWEITNITSSLNTKRTYGQLSGQLFPQRWPLSNLTELKI